MKLNDDNLVKIWVTTHVDDKFEWNDDVKEFKNSIYYQIFNVNKVPKGTHINNFNKLLSEYVTLYYVRHNNIQSKYVGFCHYRRLINLREVTNMLPEDSNDYFWCRKIITKNTSVFKQVEPNFTWIASQCGEFNAPSFITIDLIEYLKIQKRIPVDKIIDVCSQDNVKMIPNEIFVCDWKHFEELTTFIDEYLNFIFAKYKINSFDEFKDHVFVKIIKWYQLFVTYNPSEIHTSRLCYQNFDAFRTISNRNLNFGYGKSNCWRVYSYVIEILISLYLNVTYLTQIKS